VSLVEHLSGVVLAISLLAEDLRTAAATENIAIATWALVLVGAATLIAAVVAAAFALKTYRLEESHGLVVAPTLDRVGAPQLKQHLVVRENPDSSENQEAPLSLRATMRGDVNNDLMERPSVFVEVRNIGRSSVVEADVSFRIGIPELVPGLPVVPGSGIVSRGPFGQGVIRIPAIAAQTSVLIPILGLTSGSFLEVVDVSATRLARRVAQSRRERLPFAAAPVWIPPIAD
jgi:hypothetical protein